MLNKTVCTSISITFGNSDQYRCIWITSTGQNTYQFRDTQLCVGDVAPELFQQMRLLAVMMSGQCEPDHKGLLCIQLPGQSFAVFDQILSAAATGVAHKQHPVFD